MLRVLGLSFATAVVAQVVNPEIVTGNADAGAATNEALTNADAAFETTQAANQNSGSVTVQADDLPKEMACRPVRKSPQSCRPWDMQFLSTDPVIVAAEQVDAAQFVKAVKSRLSIALSTPENPLSPDDIEVYPTTGDAYTEIDNSELPDCPASETCPNAFLAMASQNEYHVHWQNNKRPARVNFLQKGRARQEPTYQPLSAEAEAAEALQLAKQTDEQAAELWAKIQNAQGVYDAALKTTEPVQEDPAYFASVQPAH